MNLARSLERRLEHLIEGLASKLFPGTVSVPELAQRLVREADLSIVEGPAGPVAPNVFGVRINPDDLGVDEAPTALTVELGSLLADHAIDTGWRLEGPIHVQLVPDPTMTAGSLDIASSVVTGKLARWAFLVERGSDVEIGIVSNRCLIGRDLVCDVRFDSAEVSRQHALLWREGDDIWLADLGSANGSMINGHAVTAPTVVANGDRITLGSVECTLRTV